MLFEGLPRSLWGPNDKQLIQRTKGWIVLFPGEVTLRLGLRRRVRVCKVDKLEGFPR